jgi:hypothetical protein
LSYSNTIPRPPSSFCKKKKKKKKKVEERERNKKRKHLYPDAHVMIALFFFCNQSSKRNCINLENLIYTQLVLSPKNRPRMAIIDEYDVYDLKLVTIGRNLYHPPWNNVLSISRIPNTKYQKNKKKDYRQGLIYKKVFEAFLDFHVLFN